MKTRLFIVSAVSAVAFALLLASCSSPLSSSSEQGSLSISIANNINTRTLVPAIDMNAASFTVAGSGPNGTTFSQSTTGGSVTVDHLSFGSWTVTVDALNSGGSVIGSGTAAATVHTGETTTVNISVVPLAGKGTLDLTVGWTASQVESPSIRATLTPPSGSATTLDFTVSGNQATYSSETIPAGYQTLTLQLLDNGIPVYGAVEVVRIVAGQTTSGTYAFTNVNQPGGTLAVNITPDMKDPIPLTISGIPSTFSAGASETATASVSDSTQNVVYLWYLNGVSVGTGASYTIPATTAAGYYRLDVTAYTADGTRGGSATAEIQISSPQLGSTWRLSSLPDTSYKWITHGDGKFVAVGSTIATSGDGESWAITSSGLQAWMSVIYGNGKFVAVRLNPVMFSTSTDGLSWNMQSYRLDSADCYSITYGNGLYVAVGDVVDQGTTSGLIETSSDGDTWTPTIVPNRLTAVTFGNGVFVALGSGVAMTSTNGTTWTTTTLPTDNSYTQVSYGNGVFIAATGSTTYLTSSDGMNWTPRSDSCPIYCLTYGNGMFVGVATASNQVATSSDGITWAHHTMPANDNWYSVAAGPGSFVAVAFNSTRVALSP